MLVIAAFFLAFPAGDYSADPYSVFMTSDSILSEINSFQYHFRYSGTGAMSNIIPVVTGRASLSVAAGSNHPLMVLDFLEVEREGTSELPAVPVSYVASRDSLYRFDFARSSVSSVPVGGNVPSVFDYPPASVMMELVLPHPFSDEIMADSIAVLFPDTVEGEPCHVFNVYYHGGETTSVWYISMIDNMPRAVERLSIHGGELLEIWNLGGIGSLLEPGEKAPEVFLAARDGFVSRIIFPREKPVLLLFFNSEGVNSLGALGSAGEMYDENIDVIGISIMETSEDLFRLTSLNIPFPIMIHGEETAEDYRVDLLPSAVLVNAQGEVVMCAEGLGSIDSENFRRAVRNI